MRQNQLSFRILPHHRSRRRLFLLLFFALLLLFDSLLLAFFLLMQNFGFMPLFIRLDVELGLVLLLLAAVLLRMIHPVLLLPFPDLLLQLASIPSKHRETVARNPIVRVGRGGARLRSRFSRRLR